MGSFRGKANTERDTSDSLALVRSKGAAPAPGRNRQQIIVVAIFILVIAAGAYFVFGYSLGQTKTTPVMDYTVQLSIQVENNNASSIRYIVPPVIGKAGGTWATHAFDKYGIDGNYPLYTGTPPQNYPGYTIIQVRSSTVQNYTLGDFFAVWGYPIGPDQTLTLTSHPPDGATWSMCVGPSQTNLRPGHWGQEVLKNDMPIILLYGKLACL
jgi:hypothetical protein